MCHLVTDLTYLIELSIELIKICDGQFSIPNYTLSTECTDPNLSEQKICQFIPNNQVCFYKTLVMNLYMCTSPESETTLSTG